MDDKVKELLDKIRGTASVAADAAADGSGRGELIENAREYNW